MMATSPFASDGLPKAAWLGLAWVYSGLLWLLGLLFMVSWGWPAGALTMAARLAATLALGVGLAATERWAWAGAVCLAAFYAALGLGAAAGGAWLLVSAGSVAPWTPLFLGFTAEMCRRAAWIGGAAAVAGAVSIRLLWQDQAEFNVPRRRPFTTLLQEGVWVALLVAMVDAFLIYGWWGLNAR
jgi:hypothetical protein